MIGKLKNIFSKKCNTCKCGVNYTNKDKILNTNKYFKKFDKFVSHSIFALPLFFIILGIIFEITFTVGGFFSSLIDSFGNIILGYLDISNIFLLAIWGGVWGLLTYLPNIIILYLFLFYLNDSGILQSFSRRFDKYLSKIGISGKGFLSMFLGFGCTVPAILSTNVIKNKKEQIIVIMSLPFISCSAKLPIFVLLVSAFISSSLQSVTLMGLYIIGIIIAIIAAKFFSKVLKHNNCALRYDLVLYRIPSLKNIFMKIIDVLGDFVKKVGIFIVPASIILTLLFSYPSGDIKHSYGTKVGTYLTKFFQPIGFNEKMAIAILPGLVGKETIVSTLGSLYYIDDNKDNSSLIKKLKEDKSISFASVISFLMFTLLYTSCIGSVFAAKSQLGKKWAFVFFLYPILLAYIVSFFVYQLLL